VTVAPPAPGLPPLPGLPDFPVDSVRRPGPGGSVVYEGLTFGLVPGYPPLLLDPHVPADSVERGGRGGPGGDVDALIAEAVAFFVERLAP
jgi:hypothetical protein